MVFPKHAQFESKTKNTQWNLPEKPLLRSVTHTNGALRVKKSPRFGGGVKTRTVLTY